MPILLSDKSGIWIVPGAISNTHRPKTPFLQLKLLGFDQRNQSTFPGNSGLKTNNHYQKQNKIITKYSSAVELISK